MNNALKELFKGYLSNKAKEELKEQLLEAIKSNNISLISDLIDKIGINEKIRSDSILQHIITIGNNDIIKTIIFEKKIDLEIEGLFGKKAIHTAVSRNNRKALLMLIIAGANIDSQSNDGWTALHYASQEGNIELIRILIEAGANRKVVDNHGHTPLDVVYKNKSETISIFKEYGDLIIQPSTTIGGIKTYEVLSVTADLVHSNKGTLSGRS